MSKNLTGSQNVVMQSNESRISFLLNLTEALIVNDSNNDLAV